MDTQWIKRDDSPTSIFNPLKTDFVASIRDDDNVPHDYIVHSMEIETYPAYIARVLIKKLITAVLDSESGKSPLIPEDVEWAREKVEVKL